MRLVGVLAGLLVLGGCGFHPLYMAHRGVDVNADLASIYVPVEPNREGQLMRQELQRRFDGPNSGIAKVFDITANPALSVEAIGIQRDNSTSRYRVNGNVTWILRKLDVAHTQVATGSARVQDGFNVIDQQYFARDMEQDAVFQRVIEALADQITQQVAIVMERQAAGRAPAAGQRPAPPQQNVPTYGTTAPVPQLTPGALPQPGLPGSDQTRQLDF